MCLALMLAACAGPRPKPESGRAWRSAYNDCEAGDQEACFWVAYDTEKTRGPAAARPLHIKACDAGVAEACVALATMAELGRAGPVDLPAHVEFLERACGLGSALGCNNLGVAWFHGEGVEKSPETSTRFYEKACGLGSTLGCANFAVALNEGRGRERDPRTALALWRKACPELPYACELLSKALKNDGAAADSMAVAREGCRAGGGKCCWIVADKLTETAPTEALRFARTACRWGEYDACELMAELSRKDEALRPETEVLMKRRCEEKGDAYSCVEQLVLEWYRTDYNPSLDARFAKWCAAGDGRACHNRCVHAENKDVTAPSCVAACAAGRQAACPKSQ